MENRAMDRIRDEMAKEKGAYVRVIGEFLTGWLLKHPEDAGKILADGKTIKGSLEAMRLFAQNHKEGTVAVVDDETAFRIVLEYFGIKKDAKPEQPHTSAEPHASADDDFDLDALMGVGR